MFGSYHVLSLVSRGGGRGGRGGNSAKMMRSGPVQTGVDGERSSAAGPGAHGGGGFGAQANGWALWVVPATLATSVWKRTIES